MRTDRASAALASVAALTSLRAAFRRRDPRALGLAALSVLAWVGYDRWHDGLWPFRDERRRVAGGYGRSR